MGKHPSGPGHLAFWKITQIVRNTLLYSAIGPMIEIIYLPFPKDWWICFCYHHFFNLFTLVNYLIKIHILLSNLNHLFLLETVHPFQPIGFSFTYHDFPWPWFHLWTEFIGILFKLNQSKCFVPCKQFVVLKVDHWPD